MMNRGRLEIMAHIVAFCLQPRLKTQVLYNANVSFRQFETYWELLSSQGLLSREVDRYAATEKGRRFIQAFSQLQSTLEDANFGAMSSRSFVQMKPNGIWARNNGSPTNLLNRRKAP